MTIQFDPSQRALVTGASGFIGSNLCRRLLELGAVVHGVSRTEQPPSEVCWHRTDLTDRDALKRVVLNVRPDVIYHLASYVTASTDLSEVCTTFDANLVAAVGVLEAAVEAGGTRVVTTGSYKELGVKDGVPGSPYAAAKLAATGYARMFHHLFELPVFNLRVFTVYGPGQRDMARLVPYTVSSLLDRCPPALTSGAHRLDWVHVDDVVDAVVAAGKVDDSGDGTPIEIGSGVLTPVRAFIDEIVRSVGSGVAPRYGAIPDRPSEPEYVANVDRAGKLLGWQPNTVLHAGVAETVAWYKAHPRTPA